MPWKIPTSGKARDVSNVQPGPGRFQRPVSPGKILE